MKKIRESSWILILLLVAAPRPAAAHFTLTKPPSWLKEDPNAVGGGGPQKGGPCGPGGYDDVKPTPISGIVTDFHVGETIEVAWTDTVAHPGYFRVALAANREDLKNPTIVQDNSCSFDESKVPMTASGNVLADGVLFRSRNGFNAPAGKMFSYMVTLPNQPCDKCTLQVMQVMEQDIKALSNCYYFHCADIRILPAGQSSGTGGSPGPGGIGGGLGTGGFGIGGAANGGTLGFGGTLGTAGVSNGAGGFVSGPGAGGFVPGTAGATSFAGTPGTAAAGTPGAVGTGAGGGAYSVGGGFNGAAAPAQGDDGGCTLAAGSRNEGSAIHIQGAWLAALFAMVRRRRSRAN